MLYAIYAIDTETTYPNKLGKALVPASDTVPETWLEEIEITDADLPYQIGMTGDTPIFLP